MCEYDATGKSAGDEASSTYEGRHISVLESELRHPYHSDGLVDKGDPVIHTVGTGHIVGVAFKSAAVATDKIAFDTEGIWYLTVLDKNDDGNSAVAAGDEIFINTTTDQTLGGTLSKRRDFETQIPFGYALGAVSNSGSGAVCAVKVHNSLYNWDFYHSNATATADDGMSLTITDTGTGTGMGRGLYVNYIQNGAKTGAGEVDGIAVDMLLEKACHYAYPLSTYIATSGNPDIVYIAGLTSYIDDIGTGTVSTVYGIDNQLNMVHAPTQSAFMRCRAQGGTPNIVFLLAGSPCATYLFQGDNQYPFVKAATSGSSAAYLKCYFDGAEYHIPLYA